MAEEKDLREENEALKRENAELKRENAQLKARVSELEARIRDLEAVVRKLGKALRINSTNSSMPPSSDMPQDRAMRQTSTPTGRKRGGQVGHEGVTRKPFPAEEVDRVIEFLPEQCTGCQAKLRGEGILVEAHQVVEVPVAPAEVSEYRRYERRCACGKTTAAEFPSEIPAVCVGPRLQAVLSTLSGRYRLSRRETQEVVVSLYGRKAEVALGTISALERRTSEALNPAYDGAIEAVRQSKSAGLDETGWPEAKGKGWLWAAVTNAISAFHVDRNRNAAAFHRLMGPKYRGTIGTDRWSSYHGHPNTRRGICWAHLKRDFNGLKELGHNGASRIGNAGLRAEAAVSSAYRRYKQGEISHSSLRTMLQPVRKKLEQVLKRGRLSTEPKAASFCRDILKRYTSLWTFTRREGFEPTNNRAERALRKAVLWRKGSFGSDSPRGSRFAERMLTVAETLRNQGRNVLEFIEATLRAFATGAHSPSLLQATSG